MCNNQISYTPRCPACGSELMENTDRFCHACGQPLVVLHNKFCTSCSLSMIDPDDRVHYCPLCGKPTELLLRRRMRGASR